jgi:hypothetical protein
MVERYASAPPAARFPLLDTLRNAYNRFAASLADLKENAERDEATILKWVDALLEKYVEFGQGQIAKQHDIRINITAPVRIGNQTQTLRPHRVIFADEAGTKIALLVMADTSPHVGRGRGRTTYARFLELLRGTGNRLGLFTNGSQFRLVYAGIDFESWCEWESDRWFDGGDGTEELDGLRQLLSPESLKPVKSGVSGLLDGVEESRKRQADLSSELRENVRQAVELLLEDVSTAHRTKTDLFAALVVSGSERQLTDAEAHEALLQATVRIVMRLVVCLFAESRRLLPVNDPIYAQAYGMRTLYELLDEATRQEGGTHVLFNRQTAWPRLMALCRLIHDGSAHGAFALRAYGGVLFRPGEAYSTDPVARALYILEHAVSVGDATIYYVLRKLLRGPLPVVKGHQKTFVDGPVDYTDLRTEFIGLIYEGLLDYRLKRTDEQTGPQVFLNLGREPVLPLSRLRDMLENDRKGLKDLLTTLKKEKVTASAVAEEEEDEEESEEQDEAEEETTEEPVVEIEGVAEEIERPSDYLDAVEAARAWAREAVVLAGLVRKQGKKESDSQYQTRIEVEATRLINRVVAPGEFYLVRAGNTRKGTGTFYTRPQLAVPTVHRTLQPLCYDKAENGTLTPKTPEDILGLKVCDPACGSASFLVAALHYLTDALYKSLCHHRKLDDPSQAKRITLPYGRSRNGHEGDELLPFPPDDPERGELFPERVKALLRRHVVERCIYGVDINPLAVEFARVSLWIETLDPELPFSFLDHKIKVGNSLVGCWLDRVEDYPLRAWEREGGDGKNGPRTQRIEELLKGPKIGSKRSGDGPIKKEMREVIESRFSRQAHMFPEEGATADQVVALARNEYEKLHSLPIADPEERQRYYREHVLASPALQQLKRAMDEWCALWFWPANQDSLQHVPTPLTFHRPSQHAVKIIEQLAIGMKFFHWELEFPEVFTLQRSGFDGMVGNPPWEVMKPSSPEFFTQFDPIYRLYSKQAALKRQESIFAATPQIKDQWDEYNGMFRAYVNWAKNVAEPFDLMLSRGTEGEVLSRSWEQKRASRSGCFRSAHPFRYQGGSDLNSYKMFSEVFLSLVSDTGRVGVVVPSGIYTDSGTTDLRSYFLDHCTWEWLFAFQNRRQIFAIHLDTKFAVCIVDKKHQRQPLLAAFLCQDVAAWERAEQYCFPLDVQLIATFSPQSRAIPELRSRHDADVIQSVYSQTTRWDSEKTVWRFDSGREFHIVDDSKLFPHIEKWSLQGFVPDPFGRWINSQGDVALPFYQGAFIQQFDPCYQGYVSGGGKSAKYRKLPYDNKRFEPQFLMATRVAERKSKGRLKIAFRAIGNPNNRRSMLCSMLSDFPGNNMLPFIHANDGDVATSCGFVALVNSFVFDYVLRIRMGSPAIGFFILEEMPLPLCEIESSEFEAVSVGAARLDFIHRRFAPEWLATRARYACLTTREWKHWWAVTEADRLRLRVEIDALCASLYGLEPDDFDWIVRDDKTDPKGFYRVDRELPFRERLTGLAGVAFRALKEGKWSAESTANLMNDEFFDILGIPELTNADAAKAKGLSGPLILKRDGCHSWHPENFPPDDPRHGWTWDDCWKDAVALLGSEEAVKEYIAEKPAEKPDASVDGEDDEPFQLKAKKPRQRQKKIF